MERTARTEKIEYALVTAPENHIREIVKHNALTNIKVIVSIGAARPVVPRGTRTYNLDPVLDYQTANAELEIAKSEPRGRINK